MEKNFLKEKSKKAKLDVNARQAEANDELNKELKSKNKKKRSEAKATKKSSNIFGKIFVSKNGYIKPKKRDMTSIPKQYVAYMYHMLTNIKQHHIKVDDEKGKQILDACGNLLIRTIRNDFKVKKDEKGNSK